MDSQEMRTEVNKKSISHFKLALLISVTLIVLGVIWGMLTWDCVKNRVVDGIKLDWAMIKDCSY